MIFKKVALALALCIAASSSALAQGTFPGLLNPGQLLGNAGAIPALAAPLSLTSPLVISGGQLACPTCAIIGSVGTVTSVSVVTANGVSATVANPTTTPALTFTLGAITPSSVAIGAGSAITSSGPGGALGSNAFNSTAFAPLASPTFTGTVTTAALTAAGAVTFSGLSTGTQVSCLGLSSGNAIVLQTGACGGAGTVSSVSVTTANGVSGTVATATTTPAITLTLGAITPSSVAATGVISAASTANSTTFASNSLYTLGGLGVTKNINLPTSTASAGTINIGSYLISIDANDNVYLGSSGNFGNISTGSFNFAAGSNGGTGVTTASDTISVGQYAGYSNRTSNYLIALGYFAAAAVGGNSGAVTNNIAIGAFALSQGGNPTTNTGHDDVCVGGGSCDLLTNGNNNNAFGSSALGTATTGSSNNAFGQSAMGGGSALTGGFNEAFGSQTLNALSGAASGNVAFGHQAMTSLGTGSNNTALGLDAGLQYIGAESNNTIVGGNCGGTTGESGTVQICTGDSTVRLDWNHTNASQWTIPGNIHALNLPTSNSAGTAGVINIGGNPAISSLGYNAWYFGDSNGLANAGSQDLGFGNGTFASATAVNASVMIGAGAGQSDVSGNGETFIGTNAGNPVLTSSNTLIGNNAGDVALGANNTIIGAGCSGTAAETGTIQLCDGGGNERFDYGHTVASVANINGPIAVGTTGHILISPTAPTISSGFGATTPTIVASNGPGAFQINVGTGSVASTGVIGLPTATTGWVCHADDITTQSTTVAYTKQTASTTASATLGNFGDTGAAGGWTASDKLNVHCFAY